MAGKKYRRGDPTIWHLVERSFGVLVLAYKTEKDICSVSDPHRSTTAVDRNSGGDNLLEGACLFSQCCTFYDQLAALPEADRTERLHLTNQLTEHCTVPKDFKADDEFWVKMDYWTVEEGLLLLFGLDPDLSKHAPLTEILGEERYHQLTWATDRARDYFKSNGLRTRLSPEDFLKWAATGPQPLRAALLAAHQQQKMRAYALQSFNHLLVEIEDRRQEQQQMLSELAPKIRDLSAESRREDGVSPESQRYTLVIAALLKEVGFDLNDKNLISQLLHLLHKFGISITEGNLQPILDDTRRCV